MMGKSWIIYADGSCLGNPGAGGWAVSIADAGADPSSCTKAVRLAGGAIDTTNNRMELEAGIAALRWVSENAGTGDQVLLRLDSQYVLKGMFEWLPGWQRRNWRSSAGKDVKNRDLWEVVPSLLSSIASNGVTLKDDWVRGHAGEPGNELVDDLARDMAVRFQSGMYDDGSQLSAELEGVKDGSWV